MNLIKSKLFKMHPHLKSHISFYSNGLAIYHGSPNNGHVKVNNGRKAAILNLIRSNFFKMHPLLKSHILFYSNAAVQGDMGWCSPNINQWSCICRLWCRLVNMFTNRHCKRVFLWARDLANNSRKTWVFYILYMFRSLGCQ